MPVERPRTASAPLVTGTAFGIAVEATFPIPELPASRPGPGFPRSRLAEATVSELKRAWPSEDVATLLTRTLPDGTLVMRVEHHDDAGFHVWAPRYGRHLVSNDGSEIRCALPRVPPWRWERLLFGQVLPLAATLRGRELLHSSAVVIGGGAFALVGSPGAGKSSVAAHLVARGASLLTDDVLALDNDGGHVVAYPGSSLTGVYRHELAAMTAAGRARVGSHLGNTHKAFLAAQVVDGPRPLRAVYFLRRGTGRSIEVNRSAVMAVQLLASSFIFYLDLPQHLVRHLDVCAQISATVPTFEVPSPASARAPEVAAAIEAHAETLAGRAS